MTDKSYKKILLGCPHCKKNLFGKCCTEFEGVCAPGMNRGYCETSYDYENMSNFYGPSGDACSRYNEGEDEDHCIFNLPQPIPLCPYCETEVSEEISIHKGAASCPHCHKNIKFSECSCDDGHYSVGGSNPYDEPSYEGWIYKSYNFLYLSCKCVISEGEWMILNTLEITGDEDDYGDNLD